MKTHIQIALDTYNQIVTHDLAIYKKVVALYFIDKDICSLLDLETFATLMKCRINNGIIQLNYSIKNNKFEIVSSRFGKKLAIKEIEVKQAYESLLPSDSITGEAEFIMRSLLFLKKIQKDKDYQKIRNTISTAELANYIVDKLPGVIDTYELVKIALRSIDLKKITQFIYNINMDIFSHLAKSILNAEYLIMDNYKSTLGKVEILYLNRTEDNGDIEIGYTNELYILPSFLKVCWLLQEACDLIGVCINDKPKFNLVSVNTDREKRFRRLPGVNTQDQFIGIPETKPFESLLESIIEMTIIDHCFRSEASSVEKLFHLFEQANCQTLYQISDLYKNVLIAAKIKAACMLNRILNDNYHQKSREIIEIDYDYIFNGKQGKNEFLEEIKPYCIPNENYLREENGNYFLKIKQDAEHSHEKIETAIEDWDYPYEESSFHDLKRYHTAIQIGMKSYREQSDFILKLHLYNEGECDAQEVIKLLKKAFHSTDDSYTPKNLSPSFFGQILKFLSQHIELHIKNPHQTLDTLNTLNEYISLFKRILNELDIYLRKYLINTPLFYRPYFHYCYYSLANPKEITFGGKIESTLIKNYDKDKFKDLFFFASLNCTPMNYQYLKALYNKYKINHRQYNYTFEKIHSETLFGKAAKLTEDFQEKLKETSQEQTKKHVELTTVSLGVFAAFIAFVTISIDMTKVAQNIHQFVIFSATFTACLLLFGIYLKHGHREFVTEERDKEGKRHYKINLAPFWNTLIIAFPLWLIFFGVIHLISLHRVFKENAQNKTLIMQNDSILRQNDSIRKANEILFTNYQELAKKCDSLLYTTTSKSDNDGRRQRNTKSN